MKKLILLCLLSAFGSNANETDTIHVERTTVYDIDGNVLVQGSKEKVDKYLASKNREVISFDTDLTPKQLISLSARAKNGDVEAQFNLGDYYLAPAGQQPRFDLAVKWLTTAGENGHAQAQAYLSDFYSDNKHDYFNPEKAHYWFKKAAQLGLGYAQLMLGYSYSDGVGIEIDESKAIYWLEIAAKNGEVVDAALALGYLYQDGQQTSKDQHKASSWFAQASKTGKQPDALMALGLLKLKGLNNEHTNQIDMPSTYSLAATNFQYANELAWIVCTHPDNLQISAEKVIALMRNIIEDPALDSTELDTIATCYAKDWQFDKAINIQTKAIARLPKDADDKQAFLDRLALYQKQQPYIKYLK